MDDPLHFSKLAVLRLLCRI